MFDARVAYFESSCINTLRSQGNVSGIELCLDIPLGKLSLSAHGLHPEQGSGGVGGEVGKLEEASLSGRSVFNLRFLRVAAGKWL